MNHKTLLVLDGNSIVNRAFYGVRALSTRDGVFTNAIFGFLNILEKLRADWSPEALCVTFDRPEPTFRKEKYDLYKAQRKPMPEELAMQLPLLRQVLDALRIPRYELAGWEADDLLGTIARLSAEKGWHVRLVTGDKDSFQLITDDTDVIHIKTRLGQTETKLYDPAAFREEYGFEPPVMVDLKALMGDSSDNIPGVPGVGEKTALDLLHRFGTLEGVYDHLPELRDTLQKKLAAGRDSAVLSYDLATIRRDAPLAFDPEENRVQAPDNDALYALFQKLEFTRLTEKYGLTPPKSGAAAAPARAAALPRRTAETDAQAEEMLASLRDGAALRWEGDLDRLALAGTKESWLVARDRFRGDYDALLRRIFSGALPKRGHEVKAAIRMLLDRELSGEGWVSDAALAAYLLEPTASSYDFAHLLDRWCALRLPAGEDEGGQLTLLPSEKSDETLLAEAEALSLLCGTLEEKLAEKNMTELYRRVELPLCPVLADMEKAGITVDRQALAAFGAYLAREAEGIREQIYALAGQEFNINSPKQLGEILFEKLGLPAPKKTKTGWATNVDVLEKLRGRYPICGLILEWRQLTKLRSTYAEGLAKCIAPDGRVHTTFQMTVTATGRLSSTDPNLQNIPVRTALGGEFRKMFAAAPGMVLVDADYSQIELRLLACISGDKAMQEAFLSGEDFHAVTASRVFDVPLEEVTPALRSRAKAVNFGVVYGISPFSLSQDIGVSVAEAKQYMNSYFDRYAGVREYMDDVVARAKKDGYVTTLFGRRRELPELKSANFNERSFGERAALNTPIQGTAADVMKLGMLRVWNALRREKLRGRLLLQIHDELIVECPPEEAEAVSALLCREMEAAASLPVPLLAEAGVGRTWYEAKS